VEEVQVAEETSPVVATTLPALTENAQRVFERRYARKGPEGEATESVEDVFRRVASTVAAEEAKWGGDVGQAEETFYDLLANLRLMPNSPTFTGAGTPLAQLAACFVLPISDDMGREEDGIFQTLRNTALIQQTGGGTGFSFSRIRPKGAVVKSSGGKATGPVGFMEVFDTVSRIVKQGGARRGANMAVLRVDHPDILDFVRCKSEEGAISNFNISVAASDDFMEAVRGDGMFDLVNPQDGSVWKTVSAREIFNEIVAGAHRNGEPGLLFMDTANRENPCPHLGDYEACNPCSEQVLLPYSNCSLASINLAVHVDTGSNGQPKVDWSKLQETVEQGVCFLDDVIDANGYVHAVPQLKDAAMRSRRIGLGIMGLADLMYHLGVRYGSEEGQELAGQVMEFIRYHAMKASVRLAEQRGSFPAIEGSIYDPDNLAWAPKEPVAPYRRVDEWGRPDPAWDELLDELKERGIRNATQTTIAPTGTVATVAGCEGYGCEPVFALAYTRHVKEDGGDVNLQYVSPLFLQALEIAGLDERTRERIIAEVTVTGSCQGVEGVPEELKRVFVVAGDIPAEEHVGMQAALQAFVDSSISKTINFPAGATREDVAGAFRLAWELGCKGLTVYVTGSRDQVVLETEATRRAKKGAEPGDTSKQVEPRPEKLRGATHKVLTPLGPAYVTVNCKEDGDPFEMFASVGKAGSDTASVAEGLGRVVSLVLRMPSPLTAKERIGQLVRQLRGIGGRQSRGFGEDRVRSLPDGLARVLAEYGDIEVEHGNGNGRGQMGLFPAGDLCELCGEATVVQSESCATCYTCGSSAC